MKLINFSRDNPTTAETSTIIILSSSMQSLMKVQQCYGKNYNKIFFFFIFTLAGITKNSRSKNNICEKKKKAMNNSKTKADLNIFIIVTFFILII